MQRNNKQCYHFFFKCNNQVHLRLHPLTSYNLTIFFNHGRQPIKWSPPKKDNLNYGPCANLKGGKINARHERYTKAPLIGDHVNCGWPGGETCLCLIRANKQNCVRSTVDSHMQCKSHTCTLQVHENIGLISVIMLTRPEEKSNLVFLG